MRHNTLLLLCLLVFQGVKLSAVPPKADYLASLLQNLLSKRAELEKIVDEIDNGECSEDYHQCVQKCDDFEELLNKAKEFFTTEKMVKMFMGYQKTLDTCREAIEALNASDNYDDASITHSSHHSKAPSVPSNATKAEGYIQESEGSKSKSKASKSSVPEPVITNNTKPGLLKSKVPTPKPTEENDESPCSCCCIALAIVALLGGCLIVVGVIFAIRAKNKKKSQL